MTDIAAHEQLHNPDLWEVFRDADQVEAATRQMAARLVDHYAGKIPLYIALLEGGRYFAERLADDMAIISADFPEFHAMKVSTYGTEYTAREPRMDKQNTDRLRSILADNPLERPVVLVDDVLDSGVTMAFMDRLLRNEYGFTQVHSVVLVEKQIERADYPTATFSCFTAEKAAWLAGCGMDDKDEPNSRILPFIVGKIARTEVAA